MCSHVWTITTCRNRNFISRTGRSLVSVKRWYYRSLRKCEELKCVLPSDLLVWVGPQPSAGPSSPCCWDDLLPWSLVVWRWTPSVELVVSCLNQASPSRETTARINGEIFWPPVWIKPFRLWLVRSHCTRLKSSMTALLLLLSVPNSRPHVILWSVKKRCEHYNKLDYYHDSRIVWRRKSLPEMNSRDKRL